MEKQTYSRKEIEKMKERLPERGLFCHKCRNFIPQFEDLTEQEKSRFLELIKKGRPMSAIQELDIIRDAH